MIPRILTAPGDTTSASAAFTELVPTSSPTTTLRLLILEHPFVYMCHKYHKRIGNPSFYEEFLSVFFQ